MLSCLIGWIWFGRQGGECAPELWLGVKESAKLQPTGSSLISYYA